MKKLFRKKATGFYLGILAAVAAVGLDVAYFALDYGDKTFSMAAFLLVLSAAVTQCVIVFLDWEVLPVFPPILMGAAVGMHLYQSFPSISDLINKIVFIGGNSKLAVAFAIYFALAGVLFVIASFMKREKE